MAIERRPGFEHLVGRSSAEQHAANIDGGENRYFLAEDAAGAPLAYAILQGIGHANGLVYLKRIAVASPGQGLGKRFLLALIRAAFEESGAAKFWLDAFVSNGRARHVYAACGLSEDGILREHYPLPDGSRADLVVMSILRREWLARQDA
ncbi:Acetyltransferase (GNAT) family protein [Rhizobium sp. RU20A]|uniref:GNAT family N-acetyltransferase n=1 Tax=Rhizobium sp. RU20A TaxID=1907412 RepID=UPI000954E75D|nr:GNAT family N-acetyltransferase [Rhizobium sp. RU20A]SIQ54455.1 Acetyltransferase (GNAT) family protein [Rhizobium sp. RU20A]